MTKYLLILILPLSLFVGCEALELDENGKVPAAEALEGGAGAIDAVNTAVPVGPWTIPLAGVSSVLVLAAELFRRRAKKNANTAKAVVDSVDALLDQFDDDAVAAAKATLKAKQPKAVRIEVEKLRD